MHRRAVADLEQDRVDAELLEVVQEAAVPLLVLGAARPHDAGADAAHRALPRDVYEMAAEPEMPGPAPVAVMSRASLTAPASKRI